jgi:hypothetical protein
VQSVLSREEEGRQGSLNGKERWINGKDESSPEGRQGKEAESSIQGKKGAEAKLKSRKTRKDRIRLLSELFTVLMEIKPSKVMLQYLLWVTIRASFCIFASVRVWVREICEKSPPDLLPSLLYLS